MQLLVYRQGATCEGAAPHLSRQQVDTGRKRSLELTNRGNSHARLSNVTIGGRRLGHGLFGYVLANSSKRWPLTSSVSGELSAEVNKGHWSSAAAR